MNKRHFTLLELMAAMVVLVIMMGFLFQFIISSQNLWSASERNARIYENAQVFFDLLQHDLNGTLTSKVPAQEISFWIGDTTSTANPFLSMVSMFAPLADGEPNVYEIHYSLDNIAGGMQRIMRSVVSEADGADWDFYGVAPAAGVPAWVGTSGTATEVIDGVESFEMRFIDAQGTVMAADTVHDRPPAAVRATLTLIDQKAVELGFTGAPLADRLDASRRVFTRVMFLSR